jgi:hypothetical protein
MTNKVKSTESLKPSSHCEAMQDCKLFSHPAVIVVIHENSYNGFQNVKQTTEMVQWTWCRDASKLGMAALTWIFIP